MKNATKHRIVSWGTLAFGATFCFFNFNSSWFITSLATYLTLQNLGVGIGLHRYLAHESFVTYKPVEYLLLFFAIISGVGSPITWVGLHRYHHKNSDSELDPHSPHHKSFTSILFNKYWTTNIPLTYFKPLIKKKPLAMLHKHYYELLFFWILANSLTLLWSSYWFVYIICLPIALCNLITSVGIYLNHKEGYRNFNTNDKSKNSLVLAALTFGDGWHNNHHQLPNHFYHGFKWWEIDPQGLFITLIRKKGAVKE